MLPRASVAADRIWEVLDCPLSITDPSDPVTPGVGAPRGELVFDHVGFAYPDASSNVVSDVSFSVGSGSTLGIVGSTGSGKSTLIQLIPRLYDVTEGSVLLDGVDVRRMSGTVPGTLRVSNDCIADLVGYAALECYGVVGMAEIDEQSSVVHLLPTYRLRKGIDVDAVGGTVTVDIHVVVEQGVNMSSVVGNLTSSVKFLLKQIAELENVEVRVHIEGMRTAH